MDLQILGSEGAIVKNYNCKYASPEIMTRVTYLSSCCYWRYSPPSSRTSVQWKPPAPVGKADQGEGPVPLEAGEGAETPPFLVGKAPRGRALDL